MRSWRIHERITGRIIDILYHGAMPRTTPYGSFNIIALLSSSSYRGTWPTTLLTLPATSRNCSILPFMLNAAQGSVAPVSNRTYSVSSSAREATTLAALRKMSRRVAAFIFDQAANASWAPSAAFRASNMDAEEHSHRTLPVPGFTTLNVVFVLISCPLICRGMVYPAFWPISAICWSMKSSVLLSMRKVRLQV